jgi:DMSO/TMAO reductase YedYZ heme-binding membrane subunit
MPKFIPRKSLSDLDLYFRTALFSLVVFAVCYGYTSYLKIPNVLNKTAADVSILLMGLSMILSGVCYFWNRFDHFIQYRKHLGMVGFAYGVAHFFLSFSAFTQLFSAATWQKGLMWPALNGALAMVIFTAMALVSNQKAARMLGGKNWKLVLRTGYLAVIFIFFHVVLLKSGRWITWFNGGMKTLPSLSLIVTVWMVLVLGMRLALWFALMRKSRQV